jgi:hypothetical protein
MSTTFIIIFILAIIAAVLCLTGVILLINGFVNKNNKQVTRGGIITGIAIVLIIFGVFFGARRCFHFMQKNCMNKEMMMNKKCGGMDEKCMKMMNCKDTLAKDSCCKMKMGDPSKCPHHQN